MFSSSTWSPASLSSYINLYLNDNWYLNITIKTNIIRMFFWFRVFFVHLVPCILLVIFNFLLCSAMKRAEQRRKRLTNRWTLQSRPGWWEGGQDSRQWFWRGSQTIIFKFPLFQCQKSSQAEQRRNRLTNKWTLQKDKKGEIYKEEGTYQKVNKSMNFRHGPCRRQIKKEYKKTFLRQFS